MKIPKDKNGMGLSVEFLSVYKHEKEILFPPSYFKLKSISRLKYYNHDENFIKTMGKIYEYEFIDYYEIHKKLPEYEPKIINFDKKSFGFNGYNSFIENIPKTNVFKFNMIKNYDCFFIGNTFCHLHEEHHFNFTFFLFEKIIKYQIEISNKIIFNYITYINAVININHTDYNIIMNKLLELSNYFRSTYIILFPNYITHKTWNISEILLFILKKMNKNSMLDDITNYTKFLFNDKNLQLNVDIKHLIYILNIKFSDFYLDFENNPKTKYIGLVEILNKYNNGIDSYTIGNIIELIIYENNELFYNFIQLIYTMYKLDINEIYFICKNKDIKYIETNFFS
jgi:hypothetical protein